MQGEDVVIALLAAVATGIVEAMFGQAWEGVSARVARLFGRGSEQREARARQLLEESRKRIEAGPAANRSALKEQEVAEWRGALKALVTEEPGVVAELADLAQLLSEAGGRQQASRNVTLKAKATGGSTVMQAGHDLHYRSARPQDEG
jgi:hypothetical protein